MYDGSIQIKGNREGYLKLMRYIIEVLSQKQAQKLESGKELDEDSMDLLIKLV